MDFQQFVDGFGPMTCIMSVQVFPDGNYGNIRILCGNKAYVNSIENPDNIAFSGMLKNEFIPDSPYERYIPKDLNFEDACYRCAVRKKPFHTYIHPERYDFWVDMYMMPVAADTDDTYYLAYSQELTPYASSRRMSNIDATVSASVLETCIKLRDTNDFAHSMQEVVNDIRKMCEADNAALILTDMEKRRFSVLCHSTASSLSDFSLEKYFNDKYDDFFDIIETWDDAIAGSTCLIIQNENDMDVLNERNPVWCDSLRKVNITSIILYPLKYNGETLGYVWAVNFNVEKTMQIRAVLESTSFFIASEISNNHLVNKLRIMSSVDMLTGVQNRNAMNKKVDSIISGEEVISENTAVLFVDLNGLKQTNDNDGHANGDKLLKKAAAILKESFPESDIYRAGGDEFMVLAYDISKETLDDTLEKLKVYQSDYQEVSFALGYCYFDSTLDIRKAMSIADKRMYDDKQQYYERFPERKRK